MKKILVPTDFSEQSEYALKTAAHLARTHNAEIYVLHVVELPVHSATDIVSAQVSSSDFPEAIFFLKLARQRFEKLLKQDFLKDIQVQEVIETQSAFNGIIETTKNSDIDLVIMGSHGVSGMKEMFIGSNTEKVVRHSEAPVLVVKQAYEHFAIDKIVFATDFEEQAVAVTDKLLSFAKLFDAKIQLLYINTANNFKTNEEIEEIKSNFINKTGMSDFIFSVYNDHKVEWGILNYMKSSDANIIAMATHGRKGLSHFFNGSISEDLVNHAHKPVLTFKM